MNLFDGFEKTAKNLTNLLKTGDLTADESYETLLNSIRGYIEEHKDILPNLWKRISEIKSKTS